MVATVSRPPKRRYLVTIKFRPEELDAVDVAAAAAGQERTPWIREAALQRAAAAAIERTEEGNHDHE
jgi:uncharacterized protein (DUF1778 family)